MARPRLKRLQTVRAQINRLKSFVASTRSEFGELGLQEESFGADLLSPELRETFARFQELSNRERRGKRRKGRRRRRELSRLLASEEGQRFQSQLTAFGKNIAENEEKIRARLKGRVTRRSLVKRIQAGRAITRRTGGLGLLGQSGSRRAAAGGV